LSRFGIYAGDFRESYQNYTDNSMENGGILRRLFQGIIPLVSSLCNVFLFKGLL
jgi:hypothetical protein